MADRRNAKVLIIGSVGSAEARTIAAALNRMGGQGIGWKITVVVSDTLAKGLEKLSKDEDIEVVHLVAPTRTEVSSFIVDCQMLANAMANHLRKPMFNASLPTLNFVCTTFTHRGLSARIGFLEDAFQLRWDASGITIQGTG